MDIHVFWTAIRRCTTILFALVCTGIAGTQPLDSPVFRWSTTNDGVRSLELEHPQVGLRMRRISEGARSGAMELCFSIRGQMSKLGRPKLVSSERLIPEGDGITWVRVLESRGPEGSWELFVQDRCLSESRFDGDCCTVPLTPLGSVDTPLYFWLIHRTVTQDQELLVGYIIEPSAKSTEFGPSMAYSLGLK